MTTPAILRAQIEAAFRDHVIAGLPSSGDNEPLKAQVRAALGVTLEVVLSSIGAGIERFSSVADMTAEATVADGQLAYVFRNNDDPSDEENGVYQWSGADSEWVPAEWYFSAVASVVQPLVDEAASHAQASQEALAAIENLAVGAAQEAVQLVADSGNTAIALVEAAAAGLVPGESAALAALMGPGGRVGVYEFGANAAGNGLMGSASSVALACSRAGPSQLVLLQETGPASQRFTGYELRWAGTQAQGVHFFSAIYEYGWMKRIRFGDAAWTASPTAAYPYQQPFGVITIDIGAHATDVTRIGCVTGVAGAWGVHSFRIVDNVTGEQVAPNHAQTAEQLFNGGRLDDLVIDWDAPVEFTGSINATALTVTAMALGSGPIRVGSRISGAGVANGLRVIAKVMGAQGGAGVYTLSASGGTVASTTMKSAVPALFDATFSGDTMTVTAISQGQIGRGQRLTGSGLPANLIVLNQAPAGGKTGTGGTGTYKISASVTAGSTAVTGEGYIPQSDHVIATDAGSTVVGQAQNCREQYLWEDADRPGDYNLILTLWPTYSVVINPANPTDAPTRAYMLDALYGTEAMTGATSGARLYRTAAIFESTNGSTCDAQVPTVRKNGTSDTYELIGGGHIPTTGGGGERLTPGTLDIRVDGVRHDTHAICTGWSRTGGVVNVFGLRVGHTFPVGAEISVTGATASICGPGNVITAVNAGAGTLSYAKAGADAGFTADAALAVHLERPILGTVRASIGYDTTAWHPGTTQLYVARYDLAVEPSRFLASGFMLPVVDLQIQSFNSYWGLMSVLASPALFYGDRFIGPATIRRLDEMTHARWTQFDAELQWAGPPPKGVVLWAADKMVLQVVRNTTPNRTDPDLSSYFQVRAGTAGEPGLQGFGGKLYNNYGVQGSGTRVLTAGQPKPWAYERYDRRFREPVSSPHLLGV